MARPEAALITGVFGSGKSTVLAEAADLLEVGGLPFAAIDVDWLGWALTAADATDAAAEHGAGAGPGAVLGSAAADVAEHPAFSDLTLENLGLVVANDRRHGIERFLLAHAVWTPGELAVLRAALDMPVRVVGLRVPLPVVQARLGADPTRGRQDDLARTEAYLAEGVDAVAVDLTLDADRPVASVARELIDWLGWLDWARPAPVAGRPNG
jgi:hypothetical protein